MTRRLLLILGLSLFLVAPQVASAADGFILVESTDVTAGKPLAVKATIYSFNGGSRTCRLIVRPPSGRSFTTPPRRASGERDVLRWRVKVPLTAVSGSWSVFARCAGLGTRRTYATVEPARARVALSDPQFVSIPDYGTGYYAWYARISNPFAYEIHEIDYRLVFRDTAGRIVKTITGENEASLVAREQGFIAGRTEIEAEVPATFSITATGDVSRRLMRPVRLQDLRLINAPPYEGAPAEITARAEAFNDSARIVTANIAYAAVFDPAGVLVNAASYYVGEISPGSSQGLEIEFGRDGAMSSPRVEAFWPATPKG